MNRKPVLWGLILKRENWGLGIERGSKTDGKENRRRFCTIPGKDKGRGRENCPALELYLSFRREVERLPALSTVEKWTRADLSNRIPMPFRERRALNTSSAESTWDFPMPFLSPVWLHCTDWRWHWKKRSASYKRRKEHLAGGWETHKNTC